MFVRAWWDMLFRTRVWRGREACNRVGQGADSRVMVASERRGPSLGDEVAQNLGERWCGKEGSAARCGSAGHAR